MSLYHGIDPLKRNIQGLFHDAVLPMPGRHYRDFRVGPAGCANGDQVQIVPGDEALQVADAGLAAATGGEFPSLARAMVTDPHQLRVWQLTNGLGMPISDHAPADDPQAIGFHCSFPANSEALANRVYLVTMFGERFSGQAPALT